MTSARIYDCVLFFNELDLLEIRLNELSEVVDRFVIVEGDRTFTGRPKPLHFLENRDRFAAFLDRIEYVVVDDAPDGNDDWAREHHQRRQIVLGLTDAHPHDIVMLSDVDEIPNQDSVRSLRDAALPAGFVQPVYYGWVNVAATEPASHRKWIGTKSVTAGDLHDGQVIREMKDGFASVFDPGGWHFSYLGGDDAVRAKLDAYSHQEFNTPKIAQEFGSALRSGFDPFGRRGFEYRTVALGATTHPSFLLEHLDRFRHLVLNPPGQDG